VHSAATRPVDVTRAYRCSSLIARFEAIAAYQNLTPADLASEKAIVAKAAELGVSAGIVLSITGQDTDVNSGPTVHASVGRRGSLSLTPSFNQLEKAGFFPKP